jgi:photosystem II stability/assembly factor-like uncharacterized protein
MRNKIWTGFAILQILFFSKSLFADDYWIRVPTPITSWLYRCTFTDTLNGWAVGDSGKIVHTSDGGNTWNIQSSGIDFFIEEVFFLNKRLGWAIANDYFFYGTTILKTTNGGVNWSSSRYPDTTFVLYTINFLDSLNGYLAGYRGVMLKTTDAGNSWERKQIDSNMVSLFPIEKVTFYNSQFGIACGGIIDISGVIWISSNFGTTWKAFSTAPEPLYDIIWLDSFRALGTGGDYEYGLNIVRSYDGGMGWDYYNPGIFGIGQKLAFRTGNEVWIPLGFSQRFAVSTDTAHTLIELPAPDSTAVYDAVFIDSTHGWAVGTNGAIYKFNTLIIGNHNQQNNIPAENKLSQNYPNPFNPSTTISFTLTKHTRVKITMYDVLGREVRVLLEDIKNPGEHKLKFDASALSSGVYFYKIEAGSYTETKKMVLIK